MNLDNYDRRYAQNTIWEEFSSLPEETQRSILIRLIVVVSEVTLRKEKVAMRDLSFPRYCLEAWRKVKEIMVSFAPEKSAALVPLSGLLPIMDLLPDWSLDELTLEIYGKRLGCRPSKVYEVLDRLKNSDGV